MVLSEFYAKEKALQIVVPGDDRVDATVVHPDFVPIDISATSDQIYNCLSGGDALFAIVIDGHRITMKDVVLPFDVANRPGPAFGARHTCALTLAGLTDALVLVVSEERANIAVIVGSSVCPANTPSELVKLVGGHYLRRTRD